MPALSGKKLVKKAEKVDQFQRQAACTVRQEAGEEGREGGSVSEVSSAPTTFSDFTLRIRKSPSQS